MYCWAFNYYPMSICNCCFQRFASHIWLAFGSAFVGAFSIWQLTDLWCININYSTLVAPQLPLRLTASGLFFAFAVAFVFVFWCAVIAFYLLAKSALNTHYLTSDTPPHKGLTTAANTASAPFAPLEPLSPTFGQ